MPHLRTLAIAATLDIVLTLLYGLDILLPWINCYTGYSATLDILTAEIMNGRWGLHHFNTTIDIMYE